MKKEVTKFINSLGCSTHYSGKTGQMFVRGPLKRTVAQEVKESFPNAPFKITYNNTPE